MNVAEILVSLVRNVSPALMLLVTVVCWIAALVMFLMGCLRLVRMGDGRGQAPSGMGTFLTFMVSVILFSFPEWLSAAGKSLFGFAPASGTAALAYGDSDSGHEELLWAVFQVIRFIGVFAFLKGWFVLRDAADGRNNATAGQGFAHIAGGLGAWHIVALIDVMQTTLGIEPLRIFGLRQDAT